MTEVIFDEGNRKKKKKLLPHLMSIVKTMFIWFSDILYLKLTCKKKKQSQPAITFSKLTIETLEPGVKYIQS